MEGRYIKNQKLTNKTTMKKLLFLFVMICMITSGCSTDPVSNNNGGTLHNQRLQDIADSLMNYYQQNRGITNGGIFIEVNAPSGNYLVSSGLDVGFDANYHFRIASCTKTFTAAAIMYLHQQGKLNIYETITSDIPGTSEPYIPNTSFFEIPNKSAITIELLLQHRAGVFDVSNTVIPNNVPQPYAGQLYTEYMLNLDPSHTFTFAELVGVVAANDLSYFTPGSAYHYSNTGYSMLGEIIERVSGMSYHDFLQNNFFTPLGMSNTSAPYVGTDINMPSPFLQSYLYEGGIQTNTTADNMSAHVSEGNLISTPANLIKWVKALLTGQTVINQSTADLMMQVVSTGQGNGYYGLGISYIEGLGFGHSGAHISFLTFMYYNPVTDITILVGTNFWDLDQLGAQLQGLVDVSKTSVAVFK
jgi:D-alanyl-D-alanine carboxypeptidase